MENETSTIKKDSPQTTQEDKEIFLSEAGAKLEQYEDPLVCQLCGNNDLTILDREEDKVYCHTCESKKKLLDKSLLPASSLVKSIKEWRQRFDEWKKGEDLTTQDLRELRETIYSTYYFNKPEKRAELEKFADQMQVAISER